MEQIQRFSPDIVHVHNTYPNYGRTWVRDLQVPLVVTLHSFRFFCAKATFVRDSQICTDCVSSPLAATRHGCYDGKARSLPYSLAGLRRRSDPLLNRADRIIVLHPLLHDLLSEAGFDPAKILLGNNTVVPLAATPDAGPAESEQRPWLFVGRLIEEKGILLLLQQWPDDALLDVIGDGPAMDQVQAMKGPNVRVLGGQDREMVTRSMSGARGLIIPSLYFEGLPLVYLEALATGLPVIAYEPNRAADLVRRDATGLVTDWEQPLAQVLNEAALTFPALSSHCRDVFTRTYSPPVFVDELLRMYTDTIEGFGR